MKLSSVRRSLWKRERVASYPALADDVAVDVAIVGAGITGLTAAYLLKREGLRVAVLERDIVGSGTSGYTTAHLTSLIDRGYQELIKQLGSDEVAELGTCLIGAIELVENLSRTLAIDCSFRRVPAYFYAEGDARYIDDELEPAKLAGLHLQRVVKAPLPFRTAAALRVERQAHFNPISYLEGLARSVHGDGSFVYEHTSVEDVSDGDPCIVKATAGTVSARHVIEATHTPLGRHLVHTLVAPYRSYALAARVRNSPEDALFWDTNEPYNYIRKHTSPEGEWLIVGGQDHKTGHGDPKAAYAALEAYVCERFDVESIPYAWSAQYYEPTDGLPYIGSSTTDSRIFFATGYSGDGMTFGTVSARLLADRVQGRVNKLADLFSPQRGRSIANSHYLREAADVAKHFIVDRIPREDVRALDAIEAGEGSLVQIGLKKVAAFRDDEGKLYAMSPVCTHMKCIVQWNAAERSWDCPCHGGRFAPTGEVLEGPPTSPLHSLDAEGH